MAAEVFLLQQVPVHQQADGVIPVVHKAQDADRARGNVKIPLHMFRPRKAQPGRADLLGEELGLEGLLTRHDKQIETRLLPVGQKEILADLAAQQSLYQFAVRDGVGVLVIHPEVFHPQAVEEIVAARLLGDALPRRTAAI